MPVSQQRLEQLQLATMYCNFDRWFKSTATSSFWWGGINLLIGIVFSFASPWGLLTLAFGIVLVAEGFYIRVRREPGVIKVAAITLALCGLWNLSSLAIAYVTHSKAVAGGHSLLWGIASLFGSYGTWNSYNLYKAIRDSVDHDLVESIRPMLNGLSKQSPEFCEFAVKPTLGDEELWRVKFQDDVGLFGKLKYVAFSKYQLDETFWLRRDDVRVEALGEKWLSSKVKARVHLGEKEKKAEMTAADLQRLQNWS